MAYRIPKVIDFPHGYEVEVIQLGHKAFEEAHGTDCYAVWIVGDHGGEIYLDKSRPYKKRIADLAHELGHAFMDWQCKVLSSGHGDPT